MILRGGGYCAEAVSCPLTPDGVINVIINVINMNRLI